MIIKEITSRRSIRAYKPDPVSDETLLEIIKAAEFAPSGRHIHPLEYVIVREPEIKDGIYEILKDEFIRQAPVLIVPISDMPKSNLYMQDLSIASGYMFLQAKAIGLGTVWKNINDQTAAEIKKILGIPDSYTLINVIPVGYPAEDPPAHAESDFDPAKIHWGKF